MGPAQHRVPVQARGTTALGAGVFQPFFLQPDSFFFRGQGDWFQPELAVIAAQHARLKHETHYRVTSSLCSGFAGRPSVARSIQRRVRIRREARTQIPLLGLSFSKELFAEWLNFFFFFFWLFNTFKEKYLYYENDVKQKERIKFWEGWKG